MSEDASIDYSVIGSGLGGQRVSEVIEIESNVFDNDSPVPFPVPVPAEEF